VSRPESQRSAGGQLLHPSEVNSSSRAVRIGPLLALQLCVPASAAACQSNSSKTVKARPGKNKAGMEISLIQVE
jgi:hypothetical protein